ncbi:probable metal-nicotianamine transporter YSL11 [Phragmites australis]|uniref:probable metal-nicotianamine transporter YSL11 n=1 Tax=Phragmites australis TaxID=29695 RepID=UPI002D7A0BD5|nr:probable metal-nicotianamine transporter YSL11 [Phragmites australis]
MSYLVSICKRWLFKRSRCNSHSPSGRTSGPYDSNRRAAKTRAPHPWQQHCTRPPATRSHRTGFQLASHIYARLLRQSRLPKRQPSQERIHTMAPGTTAAASASGGTAAHDADAVESGNLLRRLHHGRGGAGEADDGIGSAEEEAASVEQAFADKPVPSWREQLTVRAFVVGFLLSVMFNVIVMKLNLTTGIIPSLNVSASLLGFFLVRLWTAAIERMGLLKQPFTRQENTVIQTCVVSAYGLAFSGGFGSYLFGMSETIAKQATEANDAQNIKSPHLGWMIGFMFLVSFVGLFALVPLRKVMIIDYKLTYPSGTATAYLINGFHTPQGAELAKKQVRTLGKYFSLSFLWAFFQWFYTAGDDCGFSSFPALGLEAFKNKFYFDFSATYVGVGMICPYMVNVSLLLGGILSWGLMWPLISTKKGSWYPASLPASSLHGLQAYKVFITIAVILGDGLYNFLKVFSHTIEAFVLIYRNKNTNTILVSDNGTPVATTEAETFDEKRRNELFVKDQIPKTVAIGGYVIVAAITTGCLPLIIPQLKWYYILAAYIFAPVLAFCNAYGCGLTDWSLASTYGKLAIFVIGAWAGASHGGVLVGLAACGVMMSIVGTAADLMQDFKTGYMTLASPRSMFISQVIGTAMGCVIAPCIFWLFYKSFDIGASDGAYPAPYAIMYRNMAILGVDGLSLLPKNCLTLCYIFFAVAFAINLIKDRVPKKVAKFIPIPMAMAIPFYLGPYFAIDMFLGSVILFFWEWMNKADAESFGPAVASGLMCGDGIWALPQAFLSLANVKPPICMKFLSRTVNAKVDAFLGN